MYIAAFIKKGANSATVEIKIKNDSPKAYKHNLYGDYITIVRNINASGGSSYKVKSASGIPITFLFYITSFFCVISYVPMYPMIQWKFLQLLINKV